MVMVQREGILDVKDGCRLGVEQFADTQYSRADVVGDEATCKLCEAVKHNDGFGEDLAVYHHAELAGEEVEG